MEAAVDVGQQAQRLREAIHGGHETAFAELVAFAKANAVTPQLKHEALLLRFAKLGPGSQQALPPADQMLDLLQRIEHDHAEHWNEAEVAARRQALFELRAQYLTRPSGHAPVCVAKGLGKRFTRTEFHLHGVDLELRPGEVTALVGQNANGKTTLLRMVAGELRADEGTLAFPSLGQSGRIDWSRVKSNVAYLPQELPPWQGRLSDNLHYEAALRGILGQDNQREVDFFVERLGLIEHLGKRWSELSGGTKLRFALARVLVWKPKLLVLDEPLANLDPIAQSRLLQDLLDLARSPRYPQAVLMSSQHLHELEAVASTIVFLRRGEVMFNGPVDTLGRDRTYNIYELGTSADLQTVTSLFNDPRYDQPFHNGVNFVIKTSVELEANHVLQQLQEADLEISYFRDISRSVKRLFE